MTQGQPEPHARLRGVTRVFGGARGRGGVHALGPVDLDLRRGEFFAVVGPSGCGKSTLLDVLAGLSGPTEGEVEFEGGAAPLEDGSAPEGYSIKGNKNSMKYHEPDGQWYDQTEAEVYFQTAEAAEAAGFTKAGSGD